MGDRLDDMRISGVEAVGGFFGWIASRIPASIRNFWPIRMTVKVISLIRQNRVLSLAAEISFWGVLSVVPLGLVAVTALGWLDAIVGFELAEDARTELARFVTRLLGTEGTASTAVDSLFEGDTRIGLFTFGLAVAVYSASRGFTSLVGALGLISGYQSQRNWLMTRVVGVLVAILSIAIGNGLLIMLGVGRTGFGLPQPWSDIVSISIWPAAFVLLVLWAVVLLHWAPHDRTPLRDDWLGAGLTAVFWVASSYFTAWSIRAGTASATDALGLLGSGVGLLIWLYLIAASILIGAQLNAATHLERMEQATEANPAETVE